MSAIETVIVRRDGAEVTFGVEQWPAPECAAGELLVTPEFVGVCGSDLELLSGHFDEKMRVDYPVVLGHEWSGRVVEVGAGVTGFAVGQLVIGHGVLGGGGWFGLTGARGAMADAFAVPAEVCLVVPDSVNAQRAAMIEPTACAVAGIRRSGGVDPGDTAVVFGCGTLGLALVGVLAAAGATVVAVDPSERRRALATQVGAVAALPSGAGEAVRQAVFETVGSDGVEFVAEGSGNPRAQAATFALTNRASRILFMGLSSADAHDVPLRYIHERDLRIFSSNGAEPAIWAPTLRLVERSGLDLTPAISHVLGFREVATAIEAARSPETAGKVMLRPGE